MKNNQLNDLLLFFLSLVGVILISALGAVFSGVSGAFYFGSVGVILAFYFLHQKEVFYKWVFVFVFALMILNKVIGLENFTR